MAVLIVEIALGRLTKNGDMPRHTRTKPRGIACSGSIQVAVIGTSSPVRTPGLRRVEFARQDGCTSERRRRITMS
jgi:hypothetical protein